MRSFALFPSVPRKSRIWACRNEHIVLILSSKLFCWAWVRLSGNPIIAWNSKQGASYMVFYVLTAPLTHSYNKCIPEWSGRRISTLGERGLLGIQPPPQTWILVASPIIWSFCSAKKILSERRWGVGFADQHSDGQELIAHTPPLSLCAHEYYNWLQWNHKNK